MATTERIAMRDGCLLATDIYRPGEGKYPVLLMMTPYGRKGMRVFGQMLEGRGYILVVQDVRGRYDSEGTFDPIEQEKQDGPDTVDWIRQQEWDDAEAGIAVVGLSYLSEVGLALAARCPDVKAMLNVGGMADFYDVSHRGGAMVEHHSLPWTIITGFSPQPSLVGPDWQQVYATEPLSQAAAAAGLDNEIWRQWCEHPERDEYWRRWSVTGDLPKVDIPILHFSGWYDICLGPTLQLFEHFAAHSSQPQQLFIGPWSHNGVITNASKLGDTDFGSQAASRAVERMLGWFDRWLKGDEDAQLAEQNVHLFLTGANQWLTADYWPSVPAKQQQLFLDSAGGLSAAVPEAGSQGFIHDSDRPVPTVGGSVWEFPTAGLDPGPADQVRLSLREDVLGFCSESLTEPVTMAGPAALELYGELDGETADWVARLVDVAPEGSRRWVADGVVRAHYRNGDQIASPVHPGSIERYTVDLWGVGHVFASGHKIALEISGSSFPKWNLNRGSINAGKRKVRQTLHFGKQHPTSLKFWSI